MKTKELNPPNPSPTVDLKQTATAKQILWRFQKLLLLPLLLLLGRKALQKDPRKELRLQDKLVDARKEQAERDALGLSKPFDAFARRVWRARAALLLHGFPQPIDPRLLPQWHSTKSPIPLPDRRSQVQGIPAQSRQPSLRKTSPHSTPALDYRQSQS